jgi:HEAT repeat protein
MRRIELHSVLVKAAGALALGAAVFLMTVTARAADADLVPDTEALSNLSPEELFLRAASSALQFESMREPSRELLVENYEESIPYLVTQLETDGARERHALEDIFVRIGTPAVEPLIEAFESERVNEETTRGLRLASYILGRLEDPSATRPLVAARTHPDWKVRGSIAGAVGRIADQEAVPALVAMLRDGNEVVRKSAAVSIRRVAEKIDEGEFVDRKLAEDAVRALIVALDDRYYSVRYSAGDALAAIGRPAGHWLEVTAKTGEMRARLVAIRALGEIGDDDARDSLRKLLADEEWTVRAYAAQAIGRVGLDGGSRKDLQRMLESEAHPFVTLMVEGALASDEG